jgi:hypothetical protein
MTTENNSVFCLCTDRVHLIASSFEKVLEEINFLITDPTIWWFKIDEAFIEEWVVDGDMRIYWRFVDNEWKKQ